MFDNFFSTVTGIISDIRIMDIVDIAIVAFAIYKIMQFISRTRAQQLVKGLVVLIVALVVSSFLKLYTVHFILNAVMTYGLMAIIVIFYPELRRALEYLGRSRFIISRPFANVSKENVKNMISQISKAVEYFSANKTGALIVIEKEIALGDIIETGTKVDADITAMLLDTIFYEGSALHDGAVIIRGDRLLAAGCVLPLTRNDGLEGTLGTRHRAGIGVTEVSDALSIIVSEETGIISMAQEGVLSRFLDTKSIEKKLYSIYLSDMESSADSGSIMNIFRRFTNG